MKYKEKTRIGQNMKRAKKVFVRIWTEKTEYGRKCGFGAEMHKKESRSEKVWGI